MSRRTIIAVAILALSALICLIIAGRQPPEPVYHGQPLSYWLARLDKYVDKAASPNTRPYPVLPRPDYTERQKARTAIKAMGANALPELTQMLRRYDSPARKYFTAWVSRHAWLKSNLKLRPPAEEDWSRALEAITCLRPAA